MDSKQSVIYDLYNREERNLCAHLFRLLHENLNSEEDIPLKQVIRILAQKKITLSNLKAGWESLKFRNPKIYCEVAAIRDAYHNRKSSPHEFMDGLTKLIICQEQKTNCRIYSELDEALQDPKLTHPRQIKQKASELELWLNEEERVVYGALQGMFNAKPDLVICIDNKLIVFEAKFTELFDKEQLERTRKITQVWAELLFKDFGFSEPPEYCIITLGAPYTNPDISWSDILSIARSIYPENDRSVIALKAAMQIIS